MKNHWDIYKTDNLIHWKPEFDHTYIHDKYKTPIEKTYAGTLRHKNHIKCDQVKKLYNKYEVKKFFEEKGLNVPSLYYYTNRAWDIKHALRERYVAKPAHMSESDGIFINDKDFEKVNKSLNKIILKSPRLSEPDMMKQAEKGIIVEEYIEYDYEFKVFVLYGCPIVADLRKGSKEWHRVAMIDKENSYIKWDKEYNICKNIAKDLKIDFFRIDFYYVKKEDCFYAGEMAFRPSTLLGKHIEPFILSKWSEMAKY